MPKKRPKPKFRVGQVVRVVDKLWDISLPAKITHRYYEDNEWQYDLRADDSGWAAESELRPLTASETRRPR